MFVTRRIQLYIACTKIGRYPTHIIFLVWLRENLLKTEGSQLAFVVKWWGKSPETHCLKWQFIKSYPNLENCTLKTNERKVSNEDIYLHEGQPPGEWMGCLSQKIVGGVGPIAYKPYRRVFLKCGKRFPSVTLPRTP